MGRTALAVLMLSAFVVLAGCGGSGSGNGGGDLQLSLTGGDPPASAGGRMYYPMLEGESRPIRCVWTGGPVSGAPVWTIESDNPRVKHVTAHFNAMSLPPTTLGRNFVLVGPVQEEGWNKIRVEYGGQTEEIWVKGDTRDWPRPGVSAPLNPAGALLEVVADPLVWQSAAPYGALNLWTSQSGVTGVLALEARIVGNYPGAPTPQWTADESRLKFVGSSTGWTIRFRIKDLQYARFWMLTAKIGEFAVTVGISGNLM